ncbi:hypothetical protein SteCoe_18793 [Stentor coeruleus]|uniref:Uncharacterized protein n=1 Tax=Stentor coeruleus TaxID=5963 RepID=A0A1R2BVQ1_9CILI|nr:hypothetical protein SteCoe_18793 [Stentor coeruleus]
MEGSLSIFSYDKFLKTPTTPNHTAKASPINQSQAQEKKFNFGKPTENTRYVEVSSGLKIVSSRAPRNSLTYLNDIMHKYHKKTETCCKPIIKIIEKSDLEYMMQTKKSQHKLIISPERILLSRHTKNLPQPEIPYSKHSESFDSTWESITNSNKYSEKKTKIHLLHRKIPPRKTPARYLPVSEIKIQKTNPQNHIAVVNLKRDLKLLIENNFEKMYKDLMIEKMSRVRERKPFNCSILKRSDDENWGWNTPLYSPCDKKTVHFDYS